MTAAVTQKIHTTTEELGYLDAAIFHIAQIVTKIAARFFDQTENYTAYLTYLGSNNATAWQSGRFMAMQNSHLAGADKIDTWVASNTATDLKILEFVLEKKPTISRDTFIAFLERQMEEGAPALPLGKLASSLVYGDKEKASPIIDALLTVKNANLGDWNGGDHFSWFDKIGLSLRSTELDRLVDAKMPITTRERYESAIFFAKELRNPKMFFYLLEQTRTEGEKPFAAHEIIKEISKIDNRFMENLFRSHDFVIPASELPFWLPHTKRLNGDLKSHVQNLTAAEYFALPVERRLTFLDKVENMIASLETLDTIPDLSEEECKRIIRYKLSDDDKISPRLFMTLAQYLVKNYDARLMNKLIRSSNLAGATLPITFHEGGNARSIAAIIAANASLET